MMFEEYQDRVGELITGIIQQSDNRYTLVQLRERVEALLPRSEQVWNERYDHGMRVKAVITEVNAEGKGPGIVVSRRNSELIKQLFELEVPEIADSLVEIVGVAREPGYRSKIAVISHADGVDPVGACVGPRGSRVRMVVSELRGEKIDIIPYNEEPARFVAKALSPARVREVLVDDEKQEATVIVPDDQLSLAIGREGQNARLAAKLTGWKVDIKSETEFSQEEDELTYEEGEEADGRCAAVLSAGRRCPNAALAGSRYCGLPAAPGAGALRDQPGDRARPRSATRRSRSWPIPTPTRARSARSSSARRRSSSRPRRSAEERTGEARPRRPRPRKTPERGGGGRGGGRWRKTPLTEGRRGCRGAAEEAPPRQRRRLGPSPPRNPKPEARIPRDTIPRNLEEARPRDRQAGGPDQQGGARGAERGRHRGEGGRLERRGGRCPEGPGRRRRHGRGKPAKAAAKDGSKPKAKAARPAPKDADGKPASDESRPAARFAARPATALLRPARAGASAAGS